MGRNYYRYTPLDYALMGEHYEVAQYMIEQGALSITGIQDIAALKIQVICSRIVAQFTVEESTHWRPILGL